VDVLAKYVERLLTAGPSSATAPSTTTTEVPA
jgi:hypothetical protein